MDAVRAAFARIINPIVPAVAAADAPDGVIVAAVAPFAAAPAGAIAPALAPFSVVAAAPVGVVAAAVEPVLGVAVTVAPAVAVAGLAPFDPIRVALNPPQRGRPRGRPGLIGGNWQVRANRVEG